MPRRQRNDEPGAWHHVYNRGLARRTLFETDRDIRMLLSLFARVVRAGRIEVHAYAVLSTHFHFLVRSSAGELSGAMQWIQNQYARWFNRARRRDGPLFRGRFGSKRADSLTYRLNLVRYIDFNAVQAGLVAAPALYRHGSARSYAREAGPRWLTRSWIEGEIGKGARSEASPAARYAERFGDPLPAALLAWVEQRAASPRNEFDELDDLVAAAPARVADWMRRKARLADGTGIGLPLCTAEAVEREIERVRATRGDGRFDLKRGRTDVVRLLHIGLLRDLSAATVDSAANAAGVTRNVASLSASRHRNLLNTDQEYAAVAAEVASAALRRCHSTPSRAD